MAFLGLMTQRDFDILGMSKLLLLKRLIETEKFLGCPDQDSLRLGNLMDDETETGQNWTNDVDTKNPT